MSLPGCWEAERSPLEVAVTARPTDPHILPCPGHGT